ncbi:MAG: D-tyrosyl-tRNA(Tyr) deacylase [Dehalococcoidia bacterium]|nr:D-tyrosyl-tRNA(Tyr) deacylase [Dehalococcoidia bacterium]
MKVLLQRVRRAQVTVADEVVGSIGLGLVALVGVEVGDGLDDAQRMAEKTALLRIFPDDAGRFHRSVRDCEGEVLVVSQFTLMADTRRGRRPSFTQAAPPEVAEALVGQFAANLTSRGIGVATGRFRAHMVVHLENDGPVTLLLQSRE